MTAPGDSTEGRARVVGALRCAWLALSTAWAIVIVVTDQPA